MGPQRQGRNTELTGASLSSPPRSLVTGAKETRGGREGWGRPPRRKSLQAGQTSRRKAAVRTFCLLKETPSRPRAHDRASHPLRCCLFQPPTPREWHPQMLGSTAPSPVSRPLPTPSPPGLQPPQPPACRSVTAADRIVWRSSLLAKRT